MYKKIKIPLQKLRQQEPVDVREHYLEIFDDHLRWVADFDAMEPPLDKNGDEQLEMPFVRYPNYSDVTVLKKNICTIVIDFVKEMDVDLWKVRVEAWGTNNDVCVYYQSKEKALKLRNFIADWLGLEQKQDA